MLNRFRLSGLLSVLCFATLSSAAPRQYAPNWRVGDWWVVKVWQQFEHGSYLWHLERYDVAGIAKVDSSDCFVLKQRVQSSKGHIMMAGSDFYLRRKDWRVVRRVTNRAFRDSVLLSDTANYPSGLWGPFRDEPRLPEFPVRLGGRSDTTFRPWQRDDSTVLGREIASVADRALVKRLLDDGDTTGRRVLRPTGPVYQVRSELKGEVKTDSAPAEKRLTQSLQFWSKNQPWRIYEELVEYDGQKPVRRVGERTWLVASGHAEP